MLRFLQVIKKTCLYIHISFLLLVACLWYSTGRYSNMSKGSIICSLTTFSWSALTETRTNLDKMFRRLKEYYRIVTHQAVRQQAIRMDQAFNRLFYKKPSLFLSSSSSSSSSSSDFVSKFNQNSTTKPDYTSIPCIIIQHQHHQDGGHKHEKKKKKNSCCYQDNKWRAFHSQQYLPPMHPNQSFPCSCYLEQQHAAAFK